MCARVLVIVLTFVWMHVMEPTALADSCREALARLMTSRVNNRLSPDALTKAWGLFSQLSDVSHTTLHRLLVVEGTAPERILTRLVLFDDVDLNVLLAPVRHFDDRGVKGVARCASIDVEGHRDIAESLARILTDSGYTQVRRQALFQEFDQLLGTANALGNQRLLKKASFDSVHNVGGLTEVQVNANITREPNKKYGELVEVDFDRGGAGSSSIPPDIKIDTLTTTHAIQVKSKADGSILDLDGFLEGDLRQLVEEAARKNPPKTPVLAANVPFGPRLRDLCDQLGVVKAEAYVQTP